MKRPDIIITQPTHMDFPLWRYKMEKFRKYFNEIYIALSDHHTNLDISQFLIQNMPFAKFVSPTGQFKDWRQNAIREILDTHSKADWVLFLEQDFLMRDIRMWEIICEGQDDFTTLIHKEDQRVHPCFLLTLRELIEKTSKDFAANPPNYDHFGLFTKELVALAAPIELEDLGIKNKEDYYHMAGLTNNYSRFQEGMGLYKDYDFLAYNHYTRKLPVEQHPELMKLYKEIEDKHGHGAIYSYMADFFPRGEGGAW